MRLTRKYMEIKKCDHVLNIVFIQSVWGLGLSFFFSWSVCLCVWAHFGLANISLTMLEALFPLTLTTGELWQCPFCRCGRWGSQSYTPAPELRESEEQIVNLQLGPQIEAPSPHHNLYSPQFSKHKLATCPLKVSTLHHKLVLTIAAWKATVEQCSPQHTCARTTVTPLLALFPTSDFQIHLSLFAKSFYFCTNDLWTAGNFFFFFWPKFWNLRSLSKKEKKKRSHSENQRPARLNFLALWRTGMNPWNLQLLIPHMSPVTCTDDRDDREQPHQGPTVGVIAVRRFLGACLLWLPFNS